MNSVSLSAWAGARTPGLVGDLESSFLANTSANLASNPFLSPASRETIGALIDSKSAARQVGDALFMAYATDWASGLREQHGEEAVRLSWHGLSRVGFPFRTVSVAEARKRSEPREVLEVSMSGELLLNEGSDALTGGMGLMLMGLEHQPWHFLKYPTLRSKRVFFRFMSPTQIEQGLLQFFGPQSARFCLSPDLVTRVQSLNLHKLGYQPLALPTKALAVHEWLSPPLGTAIHDVGHGAFWSSHVDPCLRLAASLFAEAALEVLTPEESEKVEWSLGNLEDLHMFFMGSVFDIVAQWKNEIADRSFSGVVACFLEKWKEVPDFLGPRPEFDLVSNWASELIAGR